MAQHSTGAQDKEITLIALLEKFLDKNVKDISYFDCFQNRQLAKDNNLHGMVKKINDKMLNVELNLI